MKNWSTTKTLKEKLTSRREEKEEEGRRKFIQGLI